MAEVGLFSPLPPPVPAPREDASTQPPLRSSCLCPPTPAELCQTSICKLSPPLSFNWTETLTHRTISLYHRQQEYFPNSPSLLSWLFALTLKGNLLNPKAKQQQCWAASPSVTSAWYTCDLFCFLSWCHNSSSLRAMLVLSHRRWQNKGCPRPTTPMQERSLLCRRMHCFHPRSPVLLFVQSRFRNYNPFFINGFQIPIQSIPFFTPSTPLVCHSPGIFSLLLATLHSHSSPTHSTNKRGRARRGRERLLQVIWCNSWHIVSL